MRSDWTRRNKLWCSHQRGQTVRRQNACDQTAYSLPVWHIFLNRFFFNFDILLKNATEIGVVRKLSVQNLDCVWSMRPLADCAQSWPYSRPLKWDCFWDKNEMFLDIKLGRFENKNGRKKRPWKNFANFQSFRFATVDEYFLEGQILKNLNCSRQEHVNLSTTFCLRVKIRTRKFLGRSDFQKSRQSGTRKQI